MFLPAARSEALPELGRASRGQPSEASPNTHLKGDGAHGKGRAGTTRQKEATLNRRCVGIGMYLGPDRHDVQFTVKGLASDMQAPKRLRVARLRRLVRYLLWFTRHRGCDPDRRGHSRDLEYQPENCVTFIGRQRVPRRRQQHKQGSHRQARAPGGVGQQQARREDAHVGEDRQRRGRVHAAQRGLRSSPSFGHEIPVAPRRAQGRIVRSTAVCVGRQPR